MSRPEPRWVPRLVMEAVHVDQIREHGGLIGVRDDKSLESALAWPRQRWSKAQETELADLAAAYAVGMCSHQPFRSGNKRLGFLAAVVFLGLNGIDVVASEDEAVAKMLATDANELDEQGVAAWLASRGRTT